MPDQNSKKKNKSEKSRQCKEPLGQLQAKQFCIIWMPEEEREKKIKKLFEKTITENFLTW